MEHCPGSVRNQVRSRRNARQLTEIKADIPRAGKNGDMDSSVAHSKILVVAPNAALRHSLAFMLKAEGFDTETRSSWQPGDDIGISQALIIDHNSFSKGFRDDGVLKRLGERLIVLASSPPLPPSLEGATLVRKPLLHHELITTLHSTLNNSTT
jgi:hypothetical protein